VNRADAGGTMSPTVKSIAACVTILSLMLWISPAAMANDAAGRLEGLVVGVDGRPASGYTVHLIDESGEEHAQSTADDQGLYSFISKLDNFVDFPPLVLFVPLLLHSHSDPWHQFLDQNESPSRPYTLKTFYTGINIKSVKYRCYDL
jgi:hypothetical protein